VKIFEPNFGVVELCVTYRCNVKCMNCSNLCTQAPIHGDLTPADVKVFIDDSIACNHKWGMITIHGGEPVLNPGINAICELLYKYKIEHNPEVVLWLLTNNSCEVVRSRVTYINDKFKIPLGISTKIGDNTGMEYVAVNDSPADSGVEHDFNCFQTANCGVCYNNLGYFGCSPMAAAARVFDYKPVAKSIGSLTRRNILESFDRHCQHCGFSSPQRPRVKEQITSQTWKSSLERYNAR